MARPSSTYTPGSWFALVGPGLGALVADDFPAARLDALWDLVLDGGDADDAIAVVTAGSVLGVPTFAFAAEHGRGIRVVLHGVKVLVEHVDGRRTPVTVAEGEPWADAVFDDAEVIWLVRPSCEPGDPPLPIVCAAVPADVLAWRPAMFPLRSGRLQQTDGRGRVPAARGEAWDTAVGAAAVPADAAAADAWAPDAWARDAGGVDPWAAQAAEDDDVARKLGRLTFSTGDVLDLDGPVVLGRAPKAIEGTPARLLRVRGSGRGISRNHLLVGVDDDGAYVVDLGSRNGTVVVVPPSTAVSLNAGYPYRLVDRAIVTMADVSFEYRLR